MTNTSDHVFELIKKGGTIASDMADLFLGPVIASGASRTVYSLRGDPTAVIKVETASRSFNNIAEWDIWCNFEGTEMEKWLAPCCSISSCGIFLIQKRTKVTSEKDYPEKIPSFFTDTKFGNWGLYEDRLVCHDYANNRLYRVGAHKPMVKAEWWKERYDFNH